MMKLFKIKAMLIIGIVSEVQAVGPGGMPQYLDVDTKMAIICAQYPQARFFHSVSYHIVSDRDVPVRYVVTTAVVLDPRTSVRQILGQRTYSRWADVERNIS